MIYTVVDIFLVVATYEKYRPRHQSTALDKPDTPTAADRTRVPSFNPHANTTPTTTIGPLTECVVIFFLSVRHMYTTSTITLKK